MSQLTKGMYGHQFNPTDRTFGIACGQIRNRDMIHNGGWYNKAGEKLGWGDLSPDDFMRIRRELEDGELFIILYEQDSFWNFVLRPGLIGSMAQVKPDVEAPGVDYVTQKCAYIIGNGKFYVVPDYRMAADAETMERDGMLFSVLSRDEAKNLIAGTPAVTTPVS